MSLLRYASEEQAIVLRLDAKVMSQLDLSDAQNCYCSIVVLEQRQLGKYWMATTVRYGITSSVNIRAVELDIDWTQTVSRPYPSETERFIPSTLNSD